MPTDDDKNIKKDTKEEKEVTIEDIKSSAKISIGVSEDPENESKDNENGSETEKEPQKTDGEDANEATKETENSSKEPEIADLSSLEVKSAPAEEVAQEQIENKSILEPETTLGIGGDISSASQRRGRKKTYVVGIIITALILGATGGVLFFRMRQATDSSQDATNEESVDPTPTPVAQEETGGVVVVAPTESEEEVTEEGQLKRSEISLEILNATDITGHAGDTADTFKELGYEIDTIGNATEDTSVNLLYINPDVEGKVDVLLKDLEEKLGITEVAGPLSSSDASARIVLGE